MSTMPIAIQSENDAWSYIQKALEGNYDSDIIELDFTSWPVFKFNVKGDRYHSTITAPMMRALLELQAQLNRIYADVAYGKSAKSLTSDERKELEIVFSVVEGSSDIVADLTGFFTELAKAGMEKMTGTQIIIVVLGAAALLAGPSVYDSYLANGQILHTETNRHQLEMALVSHSSQLAEIASERDAFYSNLLKSVPDADQVTLSNYTLDKEDIQAVTSSERQTSELKRLDDLYLISSLKIKQDSYRIDLTRTSDGKSIPAELFKGHLVMSDMEKILKSFTNEIPIYLKITARVRGEIISSGNIVGLQDEKIETVLHAADNDIDREDS